MLVLVWNVRWLFRKLCNPRTFHDLKNILQVKRPTLIFLFGTCITGTHMGQSKSRLGLGGVFCVPLTRLLVSLCLLWKPGLQIMLIYSLVGHIDVRVNWSTSCITWITRFMGIWNLVSDTIPGRSYVDWAQWTLALQGKPLLATTTFGR